MKLIGLLLLVCGLSLQCQEAVEPELEAMAEPEVRRYAIAKVFLERAYWSAVNEDDVFEEKEELPGIEKDEWLGPKVAEAGFESRFLREGMTLRDCAKLVEVAAGVKRFAGKAVYDVEGEFLILKGDEKAHQGMESIVTWMVPGSIRTKVSVYELPGVTLADRSGFWEEVPAGAKLLGSLSCLAIPGQVYEAQTRDGGIDLVGELQIDDDQYVENRMTLKVDFPEGSFSWKTGFMMPLGMMWAQEIGSEDGKSGLVVVVRQDRIRLDGLLMDEAILKETGGAFLREKRLEAIRWKEPEEKPERDLTKPFHEFVVPAMFETYLTNGGSETKLVNGSSYPEFKDSKGMFWDCRELFGQNGISFREGDFMLFQERSSKVFVRLSEINLELFELMLESAGANEAPRMIRLEFAQIEGEDFRKGKVLQKVGVVLSPGLVGTARLGDDLVVQVESQIDGNDELIEWRATLSENGEAQKKPSFKTGGTLVSGRPVAIQKGFSDGVWKSWVVTGRAVALDVEIDEFLKASEGGGDEAREQTKGTWMGSGD